MNELNDTERANIDWVRVRMESLDHIEDQGAAFKFVAGKTLFDVSPDGKKMEDFIQRNRLQVIRDADGDLPIIRGLLNGGPIYLAIPKK